MTDETSPRIYVACLAAYNNGYLHGTWIDANQDADTIRDEINEMLKASPIEGAEEFAIHDYEGFEGVTISEYQGIDSVARLAAFIGEHGALGAGLLEQFCGDGCADGALDQAEAAMADNYLGQYPSLPDYMQEITTECVKIPEEVRNYIDWEAMARDAQMGGDLFVIETGYDQVHVFSGR
ncbi:antirestriction protein ArdA [Gluconacetobacter diazotrophicus]|uniref:Antirestriction protein ArdA n=1 Tax=Gluconacetobacter diazotrophicus TaxID=33996 RepID=A0A7W4I949_GLUDI|nr:antirestriction protein ArdA [Gluconacetobacter diazotrophicus]MBB2158521.1 antirestriction protein ArdA [Gluconacetobacter diazotrophicus]